MNKKQTIFISFLIFMLAFSIVGILATQKQTNENTTTSSNQVSKVKSSSQIEWNGNPLLDSTTYDAGTNKCYAERNNMRVEVYPCVAQDADGKNIEQKVNFTWKGGATQNVGWIFVYDGDLISGKVEADKEVKRQLEQTRYSNDWINNYLVNGVSNYTDLGTPDVKCQIGNTNNTMMYLVTQYGEKKVYCFSSRTVVNATAFRISGNYNKPENYFINITGITKVDVTDRFQKISNPLNDNKSYYRVDEVTFNPSQSIYTHWTYTPKDSSKSGKWHILGYDADIGLVQSISQNRYIYLDPWWSASWTKKKQIFITTADTNAYANVSVFVNVTFDSDMQADFDDLRFLDAEEDNELGYWFMNNTYYSGGNVYVYVKLNRNISNSTNATIYMYYGNPSVTTTNNIVSAFLFGDDFNGSSIDFPTKWYSATTSCYSLNGTGYLIGNQCGNKIISNLTFSQGYEAVIRMQSNSTSGAGGMYLHSAASTSYQVVNTYNGNAVGYLGGEPQYTGNPVNANQFYLLRYKNNVSGKDAISFSNDSYNIAVGDKLTREEAGSVRTGQIAMYQYSTGAFTADWVFVRRAVSTEPTVTFGAEEGGVYISIDQFPNTHLNTSDTTVNLNCNFTSLGQNISTIRINVWDTAKNVDYTNTQSLGSSVNSINVSWNTSALSDDNYTWNCYAFGTLGINATGANYSFILDATAPVITAYNITSISTNSLPISSWWNTSITDAHLGSCYYHTSDNSTNVSFGCSSNSLRQTNWTTYGIKWINIFTNDTFGNQANQSYSLSISNISITANSPADSYKSTNPSVTFNCSAMYNPASSSANISLYLDGVLNETITSSCGGTCANLGIQRTLTLNESSHTWYCKADNNDNGDTAVTATRSIIIDYTNPLITIQNATNISGESIPNSNIWIVANDTNSILCWYHTSEAPYTNNTISCSGGAAQSITWGSYGNKNIKAYVNDSVGNINYDIKYITVSNLSTYLVSPSNASWQSTATPTLSCKVYANPSAELNLSLYIDGSIVQTTTGTGTSLENNYTSSGLSEGTHNWYCIGGNMELKTADVSEIREFYVDSAGPSISVSNATNLSSLSNNMRSNIILSITDATSTPYCMYNSTQNTTLTPIGCTDTLQINWSSSGYKVIQIRANDTANNIVWNTIYLQAKQYQTNITYDSGITEGESAVFTITMNTTPIPLGSEYADLIYNGVNEGFDSRTIIDIYTSTITNTINIPSDAGNLTGKPVSFYWNLTTPNLQISPSNQTVYSLSLDNCTINGQAIYNFSVKDETTRTLLSTSGTNITTTMEAVMYSLQDTSIRWVSNTTSSDLNNFKLCVNTGWLSTSLSTYLDIEITYDAAGYYYERYNEQKTLISNSTVPKNIDLYLLTDSPTANKPYKINVKDANLIPIQDAVVEIYRKIEGTDSYLIIEAPITDDLGNAVGHLVLADAVYKIVIRKQGTILGTFNKITTTETSTCNAVYSDCYLNLQLTVTSSQFTKFDSLLGIYYNYSYDPSTREVTLEFVSADGIAKSVNLNVTTYNGQAICTESTTAVSDTLTCSIPSTINGSIISTAKVGNNLLSQIVNLVTPRTTFGDINSFRWLIAALLVPTFLLMGASSAALSIVFMALGLIILFASGFIHTNGWLGGATAVIWVFVFLFIMIMKVLKGGQKNG